MKKHLILVILVFACFGMLACGGNNPQPPEQAGIVFTGISDKSLKYGDTFDPLQGVTAADGGADCTAQIQIEGVDGLKLDPQGKIRNAGIFPLRYYIEAEGVVKAQKFAFISVELDGGSILKNGAFEAGGLLWEVSNASAEFSGAAVLTASGAAAPVSLSQGNLNLEKNRNYRVSFSAKGDSDLKVDLLDGNNDLKKGFETVFALSGSYTEFEFVFANMTAAPAAKIVFLCDGGFSIKNAGIGRANVSGDYEAPVFTGTEDKALLTGATFDYAAGVTVYDNFDGNLTNKYTVSLPKGVSAQGTKVTFPADGVYEFIYSCEDREGNTATVTRKISIAPAYPAGYQLIENGSFTQGLNSWHYDSWEGAEATFGVSGGVAEIDISKLPSAAFSPFPRLIAGNVPGAVSDRGLCVEKGGLYRLSFRIKADSARQITVIIGEILETAPWTNYFANFNAFDVTAEFQTITREFTMAGQTNFNGALAFCFGNTGTNPVATKFYLADVSLVKI